MGVLQGEWWDLLADPMYTRFPGLKAADTKQSLRPRAYHNLQHSGKGGDWGSGQETCLNYVALVLCRCSMDV